MRFIAIRLLSLAIIKDDHFVYAENGQSPGYLTCQGRFEVMRLGAGMAVSRIRLELPSLLTYLEMMLPGNATLKVYFLALDGLKTAVGLEVSRLSLEVWTDSRLRF